MRKRITWRTVVLLIGTLLAAGMEYYGRHHGGAADRSAVTTVRSEAPIPASAAPTPLPARRWRLGALELTSCELALPNSGASTAAWCTDFDVAENPARPDGRHIELHLAVLRASGEEADPDIVAMLAGGPGEAATESFADTRSYVDVLKHHNVLLLDQRGTGKSHPLACDQATGTARAQDAATDFADVRERVVRCLEEVQRSSDPRYYTTTIAVDDLDNVREALGAAQLDLVGVSYGTRVAQQYLMRHPQAVRSVVLDSPVSNQVIIPVDWAANLEAALQLNFDACVATPACRQAYGDPRQTLHALRDALRVHPHEVSYRDPRSFATVSQMLTAGSLAGLVRLFAYAPETAALLPLSIDAAAHGDVGPLLGQQQLLKQDLSSVLNNGMALSVICSEDADQLQERPQDADTMLGDSLIVIEKAQCGVWPHGARPEDFHAPLESDKPILILSGARDPVTPPRYGEEIMHGLTHGRHLVLDGQAHGVSSRGCMPKLVAQFIDEPEPEKLDVRCLSELGPTPAFVDFNGATP